MIPLAMSVRVTLECVTKAKTWLDRVRLDSSIVSLATNPEATTTSCECVWKHQKTIRTCRVRVLGIEDCCVVIHSRKG